MQEKCTVIKAIEHWYHAGFLLMLYFRCPRGPACPWVPKHPVEVLAETRFLCMSHTYAEQKYINSMRWGPPDLRMLQEQRNDEAWSTCTLPATGQEPLSSRLLTMFARDCIKPASRSDPTAWCAGKWTHTQQTTCIALFSLWKWILWACPFCYPYTAELDLLDSMHMSWKTHLLMCWKSDTSRI